MNAHLACFRQGIIKIKPITRRVRISFYFKSKGRFGRGNGVGAVVDGDVVEEEICKRRSPDVIWSKGYKICIVK